MPTDRRFLVARYRHRVVIREVTADSCAFTLSRAEAWDRAKQLVKGAPRSQDPFTRKQASVVTFTGPDFTTRNLNLSDFLPTENIADNIAEGQARESANLTATPDKPEPAPIAALVDLGVFTS